MSDFIWRALNNYRYCIPIDRMQPGYGIKTNKDNAVVPIEKPLAAHAFHTVDRHIVESTPSENVVVIDLDTVHALTARKCNASIPDRITIRKVDKNVADFYSEDVQVVVAACIHCNTREVLMLKLAKPQYAVEGYETGTLTYPQGHVTWADGQTFEESFGNSAIVEYSEFMEILRDNMFRELEEEIGFGETLGPVASELVWNADIHHIYINAPGSPERHICMLFDIEIPGEYNDLFSELETAEPEKHTVVRNRVWEIHDMRNICMWVKRSFGIISGI